MMMLTNRNKMLVALLLAAVVAFTAYTMYAKSCACKKAVADKKTTPETVGVLPKTGVDKKPVAEKVTNATDPKPVLAI